MFLPLDAAIAEEKLTKYLLVPYGSKYATKAILKGGNGLELEIVTIWMLTDQKAKFVTLVPNRYIDQE